MFTVFYSTSPLKWFFKFNFNTVIYKSAMIFNFFHLQGFYTAAVNVPCIFVLIYEICCVLRSSRIISINTSYFVCHVISFFLLSNQVHIYTTYLILIAFHNVISVIMITDNCLCQSYIKNLEKVCLLPLLVHPLLTLFFYHDKTIFLELFIVLLA